MKELEHTKDKARMHNSRFIFQQRLSSEPKCLSRSLRCKEKLVVIYATSLAGRCLEKGCVYLSVVCNTFAEPF